MCVFGVQAVYRTGGVGPAAGRLHVRLHQAQQVEYSFTTFQNQIAFFRRIPE
jgi:hypothetical protein